MTARTALAAVAFVTAAAHPVAAQQPPVEAMVRTANAAYIDALMQHQRLLAEKDPTGLPPDDVRLLLETTDQMLWAAAAMANMCASARSLTSLLGTTRCDQIASDVAKLEQQRSELRALLEN